MRATHRPASSEFSVSRLWGALTPEQRQGKKRPRRKLASPPEWVVCTESSGIFLRRKRR
jgi:hypothetical protein